MDPKARHPLEQLLGRQVDLSPAKAKLGDPQFSLAGLVS